MPWLNRRRLLAPSAAFSLLLCLCGRAPAATYYYPDYGDLFTFDPVYTEVSMGNRGGMIPFQNDTDFREYGFSHFQRASVGDNTLTRPIDLEFRGINIPAMADGHAGLGITMRLGSLDLTQVNLTMNNVRLVFGAADSTLSMRNSRLILEPTTHLNHGVPGHFTINARAGDNAIERGAGSVISSLATIRVSPGASLAFRNFNGGADEIPSRHLYFAGKDTFIDVNGGRLVLDQTKLYVNKGTARFSNGAELVTLGSEWAGGHFDKLEFSGGSRLTMGHITEVVSYEIFLRDFSGTIDGNAHLNATHVYASGISDITGVVQPAGRLAFNRLNFQDLVVAGFGGGASLKISEITDVNIDRVSLMGRAVLRLDHTAMYSRSIDLDGGRLEIGDKAQVMLYSPDQNNARIRGKLAPTAVGAELEISTSGLLTIKPGTQLVLDDRAMSTTNAGQIMIGGHLSGSGPVRGNGVVLMQSGGFLMPYQRAGYGSMHFDNALGFAAGASVVLNLDPSGALPTRPMVTYGARPVIFYGAPVIEVRGKGGLSVDALAGRSITVLAAESPGVAGTITTSGYAPTIRPVDMPALLSYSVGDTGTNGRPDVTLFMDRRPISDIQHNPALTTRNRQGAANLLIAAAASSPAITQTLNTVTNEQLAGAPDRKLSGYLDQVHPEPYSSFITVNLEMIANTRNLVFMRATDTDPSGERMWIDASESRGSINGQDGLGSFGYGLTHLTVGKDLGRWLGGAWGGYLAYGQARLTEQDLANHQLSGQTWSGGVYAQWRGPGHETRVQLAYGHGTHDSTRQYNFGDIRETLKASYASRNLHAGFRTSIDWIDRKGYELRPEIGASVTAYHQAGFTEQGSAVYGLTLDAASASAYITHVGVNARMPRIRPDVPVRPVGFARLEYDLASSRQHSVNAALQANPGNTQSFVGQGRGPLTVTLGMGLASETPGPWQVAGGVAFARHTYGSEWGVGLRVRYLW